MKKVVALLLLIPFVLSLSACFPAEEVTAEEAIVEEVQEEPAEPTPSRGDLLYEKYTGILDALEAEDYDEAIRAITEMKPEPTPPPVTQVEITLDNYLDYFDIVTEVNSGHDQKDAYGNLIYRDRTTILRLKDEYSCDPVDPGSITVGVEYDSLYREYKGAVGDFETFAAPGKPKFEGEDAQSVSYASYARMDEESERTYLWCSLFIEAMQTQASGKNKNTLLWTVPNYEIVNVSGIVNLLGS